MKPLKIFLKILGYVMVAFYIALSFVLLFSHLFDEYLRPVQRYSIGGLFLIYGVFRAFRVFQNQKDKNEK